jgi:uncharacterized membrane protein
MNRTARMRDYIGDRHSAVLTDRRRKINQQATVHAAIAGLLAVGLSATAPAAPVTPKPGQEKCYGIAPSQAPRASWRCRCSSRAGSARAAALALFVFNIVAATSYPDPSPAGLNDHAPWGVLMLVLAIQEPGRWSVDRWLRLDASRRDPS